MLINPLTCPKKNQILQKMIKVAGVLAWRELIWLDRNSLYVLFWCNYYFLHLFGAFCESGTTDLGDSDNHQDACMMLLEPNIQQMSRM
jgi:hypothetical protein